MRVGCFCLEGVMVGWPAASWSGLAVCTIADRMGMLDKHQIWEAWDLWDGIWGLWWKNACGREMFIVLASARLPFRESAVSAAWKRTGHLLSKDFPTAILSPPSPGEFNCTTMSISLVTVIDWALLQVYAPMAFPWFSETMIFAFPSCTDLRNLNFSTFPPPHSLFFPGLFLICINYPIWFTVGLCEQLNGLSGSAGNKGMGKERRGRMEEELLKPALLLRQVSVYAFRWKAFYMFSTCKS